MTNWPFLYQITVLSYYISTFTSQQRKLKCSLPLTLVLTLNWSCSNVFVGRLVVIRRCSDLFHVSWKRAPAGKNESSNTAEQCSLQCSPRISFYAAHHYHHYRWLLIILSDTRTGQRTSKILFTWMLKWFWFTHIQCESNNSLLPHSLCPTFSENISQMTVNFKRNFTHLPYVHIYLIYKIVFNYL